jgi:hypothetical protein
MSEETKERLVPVPLHILQKAARSNRSIKLILSKYLSENKLPGSQKNFEVSFDHNKEYELAEKKKKLALEQELIDKAEAEKAEKLAKLKAEVEKNEPVKVEPSVEAETVKVKNAADNKKRN